MCLYIKFCLDAIVDRFFATFACDFFRVCSLARDGACFVAEDVFVVCSKEVSF